MSPEAKQARLERAFRQRAIPEAAALLPVLDELAARPGLMWRYDTELGIRVRIPVKPITRSGGKPITCSGANRSPVPTQTDHLSERSDAWTKS